MPRPLTPDNQIPDRRLWNWQDGLMMMVIFAVMILIIKTATQFNTSYDPHVVISTRLSALPGYTLQTLLRMAIAYFISLTFTLIYAYTAYRFRFAASVLIPLLDILQSIPVLSFLPGVVLALISLFPGQRIGIEIAAILLIFTGMTWNMVFSFYQSLCSIPTELKEAAKVFRLNAWQRFWTLELPAGAIGLVWNSVMSMAGGWFFLMAIESFNLGGENFKLPGLGSYLSTAASHGNWRSIFASLGVLISIIIAIDFFIWQPLIAWAEKFKYQTQNTQEAPQSLILDFLQASPTLRAIGQQVQEIQSVVDQAIAVKFYPVSLPQQVSGTFTITRWLNWLFLSGCTIIILWGIWEGTLLLKMVDFAEWKIIIKGAILKALRVITALILSLLWTVPVGVAIGRNPRIAQFLQPLVQIAASVPATALFPVLLLALINFGGGLQIGSVALMMLGTMWYILFNVIAGAQAIPSELFEAAKVYKLSLIQRWQNLILPGIFPYLMTGVITAVGGAWNASIVSEYVEFKGKLLTTSGLGETISQSTASANYPVLLAATAVMSFLVVLTNRLVWHPLYRLAQEKYQLMV
jgi:NitT/TauT family transport system permease protein